MGIFIFSVNTYGTYAHGTLRMCMRMDVGVNSSILETKEGATEVHAICQDKAMI